MVMNLLYVLLSVVAHMYRSPVLYILLWFHLFFFLRYMYNVGVKLQFTIPAHYKMYYYEA